MDWSIRLSNVPAEDVRVKLTEAGGNNFPPALEAVATLTEALDADKVNVAIVYHGGTGDPDDSDVATVQVAVSAAVAQG
jgi:hypothetical protein